MEALGPSLSMIQIHRLDYIVNIKNRYNDLSSIIYLHFFVILKTDSNR